MVYIEDLVSKDPILRKVDKYTNFISCAQTTHTYD